jgi:hypothetical protein
MFPVYSLYVESSHDVKIRIAMVAADIIGMIFVLMAGKFIIISETKIMLNFLI